MSHVEDGTANGSRGWAMPWSEGETKRAASETGVAVQ